MANDEPAGGTADSAASTAGAVAVATVSVKLPPFWPSDPEVRFVQVEAVEAHFTTRRITVEKTKFDYVIALLSPKVATEVRDLILKPPTANPYTVLK